MELQTSEPYNSNRGTVVIIGIVGDRLVHHMTDRNLFCDAQHGFVPGRLCMMQILVTIELWAKWLEKVDPMDIIYLDFKKAFDSVPHKRILIKLEAYGIIVAPDQSPPVMHVRFEIVRGSRWLPRVFTAVW